MVVTCQSEKCGDWRQISGAAVLFSQSHNNHNVHNLLHLPPSGQNRPLYLTLSKDKPDTIDLTFHPHLVSLSATQSMHTPINSIVSKNGIMSSNLCQMFTADQEAGYFCHSTSCEAASASYRALRKAENHSVSYVSRALPHAHLFDAMHGAARSLHTCRSQVPRCSRRCLLNVCCLWLISAAGVMPPAFVRLLPS